MMLNYRDMIRGFCTVTNSFGVGVGQSALLMRFKPDPEKKASLRKWLIEEALPGLPSKEGLASAHLFEAALTPQSTNEQRIRGKDAPVDSALLITGYSAENVAALCQSEFSEQRFATHGATQVSGGVYGMAYLLTERELAKRKPH